jgi:predicted permease
VPPALGRVLTADDDRSPGGHPVTVLSHGYWQRRFGGDSGILNKIITVNGHSLTVVGVSAPGFSGFQAGRKADLFVPIMMKAPMTPAWDGLEDPKDYWLQLAGRLKPGLSRERAEAALQPTFRPMLQALVPGIKGWDAPRLQEFRNRKLLLLPGFLGRTNLKQQFGTPLLSLMGMVGLVLLIACSNLAGLLAARGAARQREYGIRLAIGASRGQLLRQSTVECLVFSLVGGALGVAVASWILQALLSTFPPDADLRQIAAQVDPRVLGFAALLSLAAGLLFGVGPAYRAARLDPARTLRGQGRGNASASREILRFRGWLVTAQVALTLVLLVSAGLFTRSLRNLGQVELGLKPDHVLSFSLSPDLNGYSPVRTAALARRLTDGLAAVPGVRGVTASEVATMTGSDWSTGVRTSAGATKSKDDSQVYRNAIGPDYFSTLGIALVAGREFGWQDAAAAPAVAVVNETTARQFFPGKSAIGQRVGFGRDKTDIDIEIVGVVRNSKSSQLSEAERPFVYTPYLQSEDLGPLTFYLRGSGSLDPYAAAIRTEVRRIDPQLPVYDIKPLDVQIDESLLTERLVFLLSISFGGLAALLAAIGIYGVLAFSVAQRRQEIGVRMALGADPPAIRRLIMNEVVRFLLVGAAIGLPVAYALGRAVESLLYGVHAADASIFAMGTALLAIVALAAAYPPARRASRTNAIDALRNE